MGERKGQNFYYPPDFDYKKHKSLNSYHGTHALRERAAKIKEGILIIRFEMPFNIWCLGCNNHIGMGVRYNAEKKKIGMYYTTPLYEFRMRCHLCQNYFLIRTDPEHFDYELVEGCRRQEKRYDPSTIDQLGAVDRGFSRQLESDRMFQVEHVKEDKEKAESSADQIGKLEWIQERMRDDFAANQALRRMFRGERGNSRIEKANDKNLLERMSLNIELLAENDEDRKLAAAVMKRKNMKFPEATEEKRNEILRKPIFSSSHPSPLANTATSKKLLSMNLLEKKYDVFSSAPTTWSRQEQNKAESLGIVIKKKKVETEDCIEADASKTLNPGEIKCDVPEVQCSEGMKSGSGEDNIYTSLSKSEEHNFDLKPVSLVADYGSDSSLEN